MSADQRDRKTVAQLIGELSKFPPDMPVMVYDFQRDDEWIPDPVVKRRTVQLLEFRGWTNYVYPSRNPEWPTADIVSIELS